MRRSFRTPELSSQHGVQGVGDHRERYIEVYFDHDRRGQGIEVKILDCLGDAILHPPLAGIVADK